MVTLHIATVKAFGVADEREGEGLTAKTPKRQKRERRFGGSRSAADDVAETSVSDANLHRRPSWIHDIRAVPTFSRSESSMKANPNPLLLLPLLAFWRFGGSILRESLTVCRGLTATAFRRPLQAGCDRNSAVERGALLDRERPLFLLLRVV